jgi:hypothetical protein
MVQSDSSSAGTGMTFAAAIKAAADRTRTGTVHQVATDETIAQLTANQGRFGVPPQALQDLMKVEQGDQPESPHEE